ncbi:hypothetical protein Y032_0028g1835 [Ancylostoma ceylanicum]|nr:hypothetical protein Y032_0028g1835 [Ancylostoma ceylanicum]
MRESVDVALERLEGCSGNHGGLLRFDTCASAYVVSKNEKDIRREIWKNGPVQAGYYVYEDFRFYRGGIYKHQWGAQTGGHAVKIIGWGKAMVNGTDTPYWLIANSWNVKWGEKGYFRMIRGENNCNLESMIYAGTMKV